MPDVQNKHEFRLQKEDLPLPSLPILTFSSSDMSGDARWDLPLRTTAAAGAKYFLHWPRCQRTSPPVGILGPGGLEVLC